MRFYIVISCLIPTYSIMIQTQIGAITLEELPTLRKELKISYRLKHMEKSTNQKEVNSKRLGRLYLLKEQIKKAILHSPWETGVNQFVISFPNLYLSDEFAPNLKPIIEDVFNQYFFTDKPNQVFRVGNIVGLYGQLKPVNIAPKPDINEASKPTNEPKLVYRQITWTAKKLELNSSYENLKYVKVGCFILTPKN